MMSSKKPKIDILIVVMQTGKQVLNYVKLKLQQNTQLQEIVDYLKSQNKLPFRNCIFTTKPAQKGQFTMQKTIKEISSQCRVKDGASVLLCYQSQVQNTLPQDPFTEALSNLDSTVKSDKNSPKKEQESNLKKQENLCVSF